MCGVVRYIKRPILIHCILYQRKGWTVCMWYDLNV